MLSERSEPAVLHPVTSHHYRERSWSALTRTLTELQRIQRTLLQRSITVPLAESAAATVPAKEVDDDFLLFSSGETNSSSGGTAACHTWLSGPPRHNTSFFALRSM